MAKFHFFYSTMNAGKSTALLQTNHNFEENNLKTLLFLPSVNNIKNKSIIKSRIGIKKEAILANKLFNFYDYTKLNISTNLKCVLIDEAQFLTKNQVNQLSKIADNLNIPVMCYGLRTDFRGKLFEGSKMLLSIADNLHELKTICTMCTKKATMVVRLDKNGIVETKGDIIRLGGDDMYKSVCRKHFRKLTNLI
jgi:thymidine kinase